MRKSRRPRDEKGKVVWPGAPRRRPKGDQDSLSDRWRWKDKLWLSLAGGGLKAKIAWPIGYVEFDGGSILWYERTEKMSLSGWEALADVWWEIKALGVGRVILAESGTWKGKIVWSWVLSPASVGRSGLTKSDRFRQKGKGRRIKKVSLSGWEALADVWWELNTRCVRRVSLTEQEAWKGRLSGREHLAGVRREIETRCVRQVKTKKVKLRGRGGSRRHPTGGKYSQSGWVSLAGRGMEKVRLSGREHLAGIRREIKTHCRTGEDGKIKLGGWEALAVTWLEMESSPPPQRWAPPQWCH